MAEAASLQRLKLTIAYDGSHFVGWQSQANGRGVQDHLERAFGVLCGGLAERNGGKIPVHASGRTDTGVHATGQVAHVDVPVGRFTVKEWVAAINGQLPRAVRVMRCQFARPGFHARFDATGKLYRYRIWNGEVMPPHELGRAWHVFQPIDLDVLRHGAGLLVGKHDFGGFAANRGGVPSGDTVRTIRDIRVTGRGLGNSSGSGSPGSLVTLAFEGDGFLYRMVRLLTGSLVRCAQGKEESEWLLRLLEPPEPGTPRLKSSFAAPAEGLTLEKVSY